MKNRDKLIDIYTRRRKSLLNYISQKTNKVKYTGIESHDILHDVVCNILSKSDEELEIISNIESFFFSCLRNRIIDYSRKVFDSNRILRVYKYFNEKGVVTSLNNGLTTLTIEEHLTHLQKAEGSNIRDIRSEGYKPIYCNEIVELFWEAVDSLKDDQKKVFVENKIDGVSFKDMAKRDNININTILAKDHRARNNIKKYVTNKIDGEINEMLDIVEN